MTVMTNLIRSSCAVLSNKKIEVISYPADSFFTHWIQIVITVAIFLKKTELFCEL